MTITTKAAPGYKANEFLRYLTQKCYYCEQLMKAILSEIKTFTGRAEIIHLIEQNEQHIDHQINCLLKILNTTNNQDSATRCLTFETLWQEGKESMLKSAAGSCLKDMQIIISIEQMILFKVSNYGVIASFYRMFDNAAIADVLEHNLLEERERHAEVCMVSATKIFNN